MRNVLITGGSGLLALNWAYCIKDQAKVYLSINRRVVHPRFAECVQLDFSDPVLLSTQLKSLDLDLVVNTIALTDVDLCELEPERAQFVNCTLAENVAIACSSLSVKLVHISTDQIFDGLNPLVDEAFQARPLNIYGQTKSNAEVSVAASSPDSLILRTCFYGWGTSYRKSYSDYLLCRIAANQVTLVPSDIYFTPVLISELVRVVSDLLRSRCQGLFHVSSDTRLSKYDFACLLALRHGSSTEMLHPIQNSQLPRRVIRPADMSLSNMKASAVATQPIGTVEDHIDLLFNQVNVKKELSSL